MYPAGVIFKSYFLERLPTLLLKMSEAEMKIKCYFSITIDLVIDLHPDPARALNVTVMINENQIPKIPKRLRTLWFFTGANMLNDC